MAIAHVQHELQCVSLAQERQNWNQEVLKRNNPGLRDKPVFIIPSPTQEGKGIVNWLVSHAGIIKYNVRNDYYMITDWNVKYRKWFGQAGAF